MHSRSSKWKKKKRKIKKYLPCLSPKTMLERQNAELVSLIYNSGEEFVCIKHQQPEKESSNKKIKKKKKRKKHSWTLRFRYESTGLFLDHSFMNRGSYQITKVNSQYTWYHLYCHNLELRGGEGGGGDGWGRQKRKKVEAWPACWLTKTLLCVTGMK